MSSLAVVRAAAAAALAAVVGCEPMEDDTPPPGPPCLPSPQGVRYAATLLQRYDASSDYYYESSSSAWGPSVSSGSWSSCDGEDRLQIGATVAFTTGRYAPRLAGGGCSYREMVDVEGVGVRPGQYEDFPTGTEGATVAGWRRQAVFHTEKLPYSLVLTAPTGDLGATPLPGELPSAVLYRSMKACGDAWVVEISEVTE